MKNSLLLGHIIVITFSNVCHSLEKCDIYHNIENDLCCAPSCTDGSVCKASDYTCPKTMNLLQSRFDLNACMLKNRTSTAKYICVKTCPSTHHSVVTNKQQVCVECTILCQDDTFKNFNNSCNCYKNGRNQNEYNVFFIPFVTAAVIAGILFVLVIGCLVLHHRKGKQRSREEFFISMELEENSKRHPSKEISKCERPLTKNVDKTFHQVSTIATEAQTKQDSMTRYVKDPTEKLKSKERKKQNEEERSSTYVNQSSVRLQELLNKQDKYNHGSHGDESRKYKNKHGDKNMESPTHNTMAMECESNLDIAYMEESKRTCTARKSFMDSKVNNMKKTNAKLEGNNSFGMKKPEKRNDLLVKTNKTFKEHGEDKFETLHTPEITIELCAGGNGHDNLLANKSHLINPHISVDSGDQTKISSESIIPRKKENKNLIVPKMKEESKNRESSTSHTSASSNNSNGSYHSVDEYPSNKLVSNTDLTKTETATKFDGCRISKRKDKEEDTNQLQKNQSEKVENRESSISDTSTDSCNSNKSFHSAKEFQIEQPENSCISSEKSKNIEKTGNILAVAANSGNQAVKPNNNYENVAISKYGNKGHSPPSTGSDQSNTYCHAIQETETNQSEQPGNWSPTAIKEINQQSITIPTETTVQHGEISMHGVKPTIGSTSKNTMQCNFSGAKINNLIVCTSNHANDN